MASTTATPNNSNSAAIPNRPVLKVAYDYEYDYKTRRISVNAGELLHLLQKTNEHWWKVVRPSAITPNKPFFVPAQYVIEVENEDAHHKKRNGEKSVLTKFHSLSLSESSPGASPSPTSKNGATAASHENLLSKGKEGESSKSKSKESSFFSFSKSGSKSNKRNEGSRASHREKNSKQSAKCLNSTGSGSTSSAAKLKNWSASLEELSKQIVFPGLVSESVADLTFASRLEEDREGRGNLGPFERASFSSFYSDGIPNQGREVPPPSLLQSDSLNKCLTFRNPNFSDKPANSSKSPASQEKLEADTYQNDIPPLSTSKISEDNSLENMETDNTSIGRNASVCSGTQEAGLPSTPVSSPVRKLADGWAEYYSPESKRYFYYNSKSQITSWKPPRNSSSSNKKSDEHLGSSLSDGSANASSFEKSLENIPDLVGSPNLSFEAELTADKASNSLSDNDNVTNTVLIKGSSTGRSQSSESVMSMKEEENNELLCHDEIPVPEGYERQWDEATQQFCFVNKVTGTRWFTSTDSQARVYYYEENSSNSSWFLPVPDPTKSPVAQGDVTQENLDPSSLPSYGVVKKRHSAGEVADRNLKTKSLISPGDLSRKPLQKTGSLPRAYRTIWIPGATNFIIREGPITRSKITENGKKLRKSWGIVYGVLTERHLSLFKDQKTFSVFGKTELEIDLDGAIVEWTEEKSSRKNVFQLSTQSAGSELQLLFQVDDKGLAGEWFNDIKLVAERLDSVLDISMRFRSSESPESALDQTVGEGKISSRLYRNKSTKLRITPAVDDKEKVKIKDRLKKFFSNRPPRESLVKKGIYKDESVFGCSLDKLCANERVDVPLFVQECILAIESKTENLKTDGIYRASGNLSQVQKIRLQVDQNKVQCLHLEDDVHVLAGCLKLFFRELKEPLIPSELFEKALQACHAFSKKEKVSRLREIVSALPKPNKCTLQALLKHLLKVASFSEFNRMQIPNLAIVFGPTLMYAAESQNMATDLMQQNLVIEALLLEYDSIFQ